MQPFDDSEPQDPPTSRIERYSLRRRPTAAELCPDAVAAADRDFRSHQTLADRASTSTSQISSFPSSSPRTVATSEGTVTLSEGELGVLSRAVVSNRVAIVSPTAKDNTTDKVLSLVDGVRQFIGFNYSQDSKTSGCLTMPAPYADQKAQRLRAVRLLALPDAVKEISRGEYRVRSESGPGFYRVERWKIRWHCECRSANELWPLYCKHIWAVRIALRPKEYASVAKYDGGPKPRKARDFRAIDAAQQAEELEFDGVLWNLLQQVEEPARPIGKPGRPSIPLRTQLFHAVRKVQLGKSSRAAHGLIKLTSVGPDRLLGDLPNFTVPSRLLNRPGTADLLLQLIELSALPLRQLEDGGTVAVDSTGFSTTVRGAYSSEKHNPGKRHRWVKGHFIIGTRTHAILAVAVTDERGADSPQFIGLVRKAVEAGFRPAICVADRAYVSRDAYNTLAELGIDGYLPFREGMTGKSLGSRTYHRKFVEWSTQRAKFDERYHARSNIESTNAALKAKLQEGLRSKNPEARFNEVLVKVLAYNIGVLIGESYRSGLDPSAPASPPRAIPPPDAAALPPALEAATV